MIKVFNKWSAEDVSVQDPGVQKYINLEPKIVPKSF